MKGSLIKQFLRDFSPWILFGLLASTGWVSVQIASVVSLAALLIFGYRHLKKGFILDWGTLLFFGYLVIGSFLPYYNWVEKHASLLSSLALTIIIWFSIVVRTPFTIQYAKERVPRGFWKRPLFVRTNYYISLCWAIVFSLMTVLNFLQDFGVIKSIWLIDIAPIFLIILGIHFTIWFPNYYKDRKVQIPAVPIVNISETKNFPLKDGTALIIRPAKEKDASEIAYYMEMASGGIIDFLLSDLVEDVSAIELMESLIAEKKGEYTYKNATVCEIEGKVIGMAHCFPMEHNICPESEGGFIPSERVTHLAPMYKKTIKDSFYLHTIAIDPIHQGKKIGSHLLDYVKQRAHAHHFSSITLHAWADNQVALDWYKKNGFEHVEAIAIERAPLLPHDGGMLLLKLPLS